MKLLFKIYCLLFITVSSVYGQEITIFDQSYETKPSTYILLDLKNIDFRVEQSIDDKVHILVHTTFHNYSKKNIEKYRKRMRIGLMSSNNKNYIGIVGSGSFFSTPSSYISKGKLNNLSSYKKDTIEAKKTKQKILEQIGFDDQTKTLSLFKIKPNVVKMKSAKKSRSFSENFVIKIPKNLLLKIKGENTNFAIKEIDNPLEININRGGVYAKKLSNQSNKIYLKDAFLRVEEINGGDYKLNDVYKGLIGEMKNATITSNFSKLEIGEIQENTKITDFNGKLWFYDFSEDFKDFNLKSEYSKIHLFYPKTDFNLTAMGNNAINIKIHYPNKEIVGGTATADSLYKMINKKAKGIGKYSGDMQLEIDNGIIHIYKNELDVGDK